MKNEYIELNILIKRLIYTTQRNEYSKSFLEFYCEDPFKNNFLLQIHWDLNKLFWSRTTWLKNFNLEELFKTNRFEENKQDFRFQLLNESNELELDSFLKVLNWIDNSSLPLVLIDEEYGRDGFFIEARIGYKSFSTQFQYLTSSLPKKWESLNEFTNLILEFNKNLIPKVTNNYTIHYISESLNKNKQEFISIQY